MSVELFWKCPEDCGHGIVASSPWQMENQIHLHYYQHHEQLDHPTDPQIHLAQGGEIKLDR
jgi:hypothetical protein